MARGLDHVVHVVHDLEAAAALYRRLGFVVGARNRHPWGTHNHIVQLPGFFLEPLTVAEPENIGSDGLSVLFAQFNQSFLQRAEGLSLLILESRDATADAAAFAAAGIAASEKLTFEHEGRRPDGTPVTVGFSLAFARDARAPSIGFATCQQHHPANFWNPAFQDHPNTVTGVAGVVLVAENPSDHHIFLSAFAGERELLATSSGITVRTPRGEIEVMTPDAFRRHFGVPAPDIADSARIAALRLAVRDLAAAKALLREAGLSIGEVSGRAVVSPEQAMGATIVFEAAA
jgi:catechol 2,3-dioxygenase-like lactoylglutathione lyase family enzyme